MARISARRVHGVVRPGQRDEGPKSLGRAALQATGFGGFVTVSELRRGRISDVPRKPGLYLVFCEKDDPPAFLPISPAGRFDGKDPTVNVSVLKATWVSGAHILYIGKTNQQNGLQKRLRDFIEFGAGKPIGHWGGRYLWQVTDSSEFVIGWRESPEAVSPRDEERQLLRRFREAYRQLPFANLKN